MNCKNSELVALAYKFRCRTLSSKRMVTKVKPFKLVPDKDAHGY